MEDSEKMLDVAEPTMEETESTVTVPEEAETNEEKFEFEEVAETQNSTDEKTTEKLEDVKKSDEKETETDNKVQDKEENSKYAQARRKAEAEAELKAKEAYRKGKLEAYIGKINPYTQTTIMDETDVQVYENMYELEKKGKDPIADYASYIADKQREETKAKEEQEKLVKEAEQDIADFTEKYPDINLTELLENESFKDYIEGKRKPLVTLYENYKKMETRFRNKAVEVAKQTIANSQATPGSLNSGADVNIDYSNMTDEEFEKVLNAVKNGELK